MVTPARGDSTAPGALCGLTPESFQPLSRVPAVSVEAIRETPEYICSWLTKESSTAPLAWLAARSPALTVWPWPTPRTLWKPPRSGASEAAAGEAPSSATASVTSTPILPMTAANTSLVGMGRIPINIAEFVGGTPMVRLTRMLPPDAAEGVEIYAKVESFNPGGSVKDRIGVAMIEEAEADGAIEPGRTTVVEATSGNTGIALAFVCAAKGYDLVLTLPQGMTRERERLLRLYGARVDIIESMGGMNEAVEAARELASRDGYWMARQFENPANPEAHRRTTAPEILAALDRVDVFVAGVGTGGTITGTGQVLKERNPDCQIVAVEPRSSPVLSGGPPGPHRIDGIGAGFVPPVLDRDLLDEVIAVSNDDAVQTAVALARTEGILSGISCGANVWAAMEIARRPESRGKRIVTVLPDSGERYVSMPFFGP